SRATRDAGLKHFTRRARRGKESVRRFALQKKILRALRFLRALRVKRLKSFSREEALGESSGEGGELEGGFEEGEDQREGRGAFGLDRDAFAGLGVLGGAAGDGVRAVRADLDHQPGDHRWLPLRFDRARAGLLAQ